MRGGKMRAVVVLSVLGLLAPLPNVSAQERSIPSTLRHRDGAATQLQPLSRMIAEGKPLKEIQTRWMAHMQGMVKRKKSR